MKKIISSIIILFFLLVIPSCGDDAPMQNPIDNQVIIPSTSKVVDSTDFANHLISISQDTSVFTFSNGSLVIDNLQPGDVMISKYSFGVLRKVITKQNSNNNVIITTQKTSIGSAVEKGRVSLSRRLKPSDTLMTIHYGNSKLKQLLKNSDIFEWTFDEDFGPGDLINCKGDLKLSIDYIFNAEFEDNKLKNLDFGLTKTQETSIEVSCSQSIVNFDESIEIARIYFTPITVFIGFVPVVFVPVLSINVGVNGEIQASMHTSITQEITNTEGIRYNGTWAPYSTTSHVLNFQPPAFTAGANFEAYIGPKFDLLLYGLIGPYIEAKLYGELDAEFFPTQYAELYSGLKVGGGIKIELFDIYTIGYWKDDIINLRVKIWEWQNSNNYIVPLSVGNFWQYRDTNFVNNQTSSSRLDINGTRTINYQGNNIMVYDWQWQSSSTKYYTRNEPAGCMVYGNTVSGVTTPELIAKYPANVNDSWVSTFWAPGYTVNVQCASTNENFATPLGNFQCYVYHFQINTLNLFEPGNNELLKKDFTTNSSVAYDYYLYFKPNIGYIGYVAKQGSQTVLKKVMYSYHVN